MHTPISFLRLPTWWTPTWRLRLLVLSINGAISVALAVAACVILPAFGIPASPFFEVAMFLVLAHPVALAVAILRHRLGIRGLLDA